MFRLRWQRTSLTNTYTQGVKDAPAPRPNKRPRLGPSPVESASPNSEKPSTKSKKAIKNGSDPQFEEFAKATRSRTQKGPSWANEDADIQPSSSTASGSGKSKIPSHIPSSETLPSPSGSTNPEGLSDLDWLKRHTKSSLDVSSVNAEQTFEQSDEDGSQEVRLRSFFLDFVLTRALRMRRKNRRIRRRPQFWRHRVCFCGIFPSLVQRTNSWYFSSHLEKFLR